jgi:hypothetical protein
MNRKPATTGRLSPSRDESRRRVPLRCREAGPKHRPSDVRTCATTDGETRSGKASSTSERFLAATCGRDEPAAPATRCTR